MLFDLGACCDCEGGSTITVARCGGTGAANVGIEGVRVVVKRLGSTIFDGDTDAEGKVKLTLPTAFATYSVELYPGPANFRYKDTTLSVGSGALPANLVVRPNPADGFHCVFPDVHPLSDELLVSLPDGDYTVKTGTLGWTGPWGTNTTHASVFPLYGQVDFVWDCGRTGPTRLGISVLVREDLALKITVRWAESKGPGSPCSTPNYSNFGGVGDGQSESDWTPVPGSLPLYASGTMTQTLGVLPNPTGGDSFVIAEVLP